ncbi:MAG TPA: rhodanese-like domain-containing protein [Thermoanaerobaculia bacterium]|nr:rhodanese-like domain-containing protein [Thermoanaerobaculia bacterium]
MKRLPALLVLILVFTAFAGCSLFRRKGDRPVYRKLTPPVAYEMMRDSPDMLIIDLRAAAAFNSETGHVRQARNIPLERLPYRLLEISTFRDETFIVYCDVPVCAEEGMNILISSGFENAVLMDGGIDQWIKEGFKTVLPTETAGRTGAEGERLRPLRPGEEKPAADTETPSSPPPPHLKFLQGGL